MAIASETAVQELVIVRVLSAPRELVWRAWTEDEHMMRWGAPHGFVVTHCEGALRVGGAWRSCMKSPDGEELWLGGEYREIVAPEKLVFTHLWDNENGQPGPETLVTLTLEEEGDKTKMTFRQSGFASASSREGHEGGWSESFERLHKYLQKLQKEKTMSNTDQSVLKHLKNALTVTAQGEREIVLSRTFDAPRELVFAAISTPEHIRRWWGRRQDTMISCEIDCRVGGAWRFVVSGPDGEHGFRGEYREIVPPQRVVQTFEWEGLPGHISQETLSLEECDGQTTMTINCVFDSLEDRDGMLHSGMEQGAGESYNRLEELLAELAQTAS